MFTSHKTNVRTTPSHRSSRKRNCPFSSQQFHVLQSRCVRSCDAFIFNINLRFTCVVVSVITIINNVQNISRYILNFLHICYLNYSNIFRSLKQTTYILFETCVCAHVSVTLQYHMM